MSKLTLTSKKAFVLFLFITFLLVAQAVWWIVLMAKLFDEKVEIVEKLGGDHEYLAFIQEEEISRQIMIDHFSASHGGDKGLIMGDWSPDYPHINMTARSKDQ